MVAPRVLQLPLLFVTGILSTKFDVNRFKESCPKPAVVDLTEEIPDILGFVNKSGDVYRPEITWVEDDKRFGCSCDFKLCIPLCCPEGHAIIGNICTDSNSTFLITDLDTEMITFYPHSCDSFDNFTWDQDFEVLPNGSIYIISRSEIVDLGGYCLKYEVHSRKYSAVKCMGLEWYESWISYGVCLSISMLFTLATFIVCNITPGLRNLYGLILRYVLASNVAGILVILTGEIVMSMFNLTTPADLYLHNITDYAFLYFASACTLWLNVMSFDIWRTFRRCRSRSEVYMKKRQKAKFVCYAIYVWGGSAAYIAIPILCQISGYPFDPLTSTWSIMWCWHNLPFFGIGVCNTCLYILTALRIRRFKKEAAHLVDGVNKHHHENEQWFNLYVKLFVIMGGPMILEAVANLLKCKMCIFAIFALDALQIIFIFLTLVCKDDVKLALSKRFYGMQELTANS